MVYGGRQTVGPPLLQIILQSTLKRGRLWYLFSPSTCDTMKSDQNNGDAIKHCVRSPSITILKNTRDLLTITNLTNWQEM